MLLLPSSLSPGERVQIIDTRHGRLVTSAQTDRFNLLYWQIWPALLDSHAAIVVAGADYGPAFAVGAVHGNPASFGPRKEMSLVAVAQSVAYFMSSSSCPPGGPRVAGVDISTGRTLWNARLPATLCTSAAGSPQLLPYDNGFAVPAVDGHVFLYR